MTLSLQTVLKRVGPPSGLSGLPCTPQRPAPTITATRSPAASPRRTADQPTQVETEAGMARDGQLRPNEALQLTKREYLVGRPASRASVIESRFAAERRCSTDLMDDPAPA